MIQEGSGDCRAIPGIHDAAQSADDDDSIRGPSRGTAALLTQLRLGWPVAGRNCQLPRGLLASSGVVMGLTRKRGVYPLMVPGRADD